MVRVEYEDGGKQFVYVFPDATALTAEVAGQIPYSGFAKWQITENNAEFPFTTIGVGLGPVATSPASVSKLLDTRIAEGEAKMREHLGISEEPTAESLLSQAESVLSCGVSNSYMDNALHLVRRARKLLGDHDE